MTTTNPLLVRSLVRCLMKMSAAEVDALYVSYPFRDRSTPRDSRTAAAAAFEVYAGLTRGPRVYFPQHRARLSETHLRGEALRVARAARRSAGFRL